MSNLVEFLRARLDEERAVALSVQAVTPKSHADVFTSLSAPTGTVEMSPGRVLADVEAKRGIVDLHDELAAEVEATDDDAIATALAYRANGLWEAMQHLAASFAQHPDYDPDWKP